MTFFKGLELIGFVFGIAGVWLTVRKNIWCFPVGIVNVLITAYLVYDRHLFAGALQQLVYFVLLVVGWIMWSRTKQKEQDIRVGTLRRSDYFLLLMVFLAGSAFLSWLLKNYSNASLPVADSTATVLAFLAQWLIARRKIENWILWLVVNSAYLVIFLIKDMPLYAILSAVYFILAWMGWKHWLHILKKQHAESG
jgi:nicotinamide mononucleotide transporter